jgi:hypothetical protein
LRKFLVSFGKNVDSHNKTSKTTPLLRDSAPTDNLQVTQDCNTNEGTILTVFSTFDWVSNAIAVNIKIDELICTPNGSTLIIVYTSEKYWQFRLISHTGSIFSSERIYYTP